MNEIECYREIQWNNLKNKTIRHLIQLNYLKNEIETLNSIKVKLIQSKSINKYKEIISIIKLRHLIQLKQIELNCVKNEIETLNSIKIKSIKSKSIDKNKEIISIIKLRHSIQLKQKELNWIALKLKFKYLIQLKLNEFNQNILINTKKSSL